MEDQEIEALIEQLRTSKDLFVQLGALTRLGEIGVGHPKAIEKLIRLIETAQSFLTRDLAVKSLEKIGAGHPKAIEGLIKLIETTQSELLRRLAVKSLEKIGVGHPKAIEGLIKLIETTQLEITRRLAAQSLGEIGAGGHPKAIEGLIKVIETTQSETTRWLAAQSLEKIVASHPKAIKELIKLLKTSQRYFLLRLIREILGRIGIHHPIAIEELRELLHTTSSEYIRWFVTETLQTIDPTTESQAQTEKDNLALFLQVSRVKETADHYLSSNYHTKAKFCYHRIIACLDKLQQGQDIVTRRSLMNSYLDIYRRIVTFSIQMRDFKSAFFYAEILRNRYLVDRIAHHDAPLPTTISPTLAAQIDQAKQTERKTLQAYTDGISQQLNEQQLFELSNQWDQAKQTLENLYGEVALSEPEFIAKTKVYPISFADVQKSLPPDTAILDFFFTGTQLVTMLILPGATTPIIPPDLCLKFQVNPLKPFAQAWISDISAKSISKTDLTLDKTIQDLPENINKLTDFLNFRRLLNHLPQTIQHLIIVPSNYLYLFPVHALWLNDHQRVIDRFSVQYFPNLQMWKTCQSRHRSSQSFISVENPTQDGDLIFAKAEVATICQHPTFEKTEILRGQNAAKSTIIETAKHHHCFHFSGHAEYNFEDPLNSYLMLSENSNQNLTLSAILADISMPQTDLVTLSACCTGVVDAFQPTDEYIGLPTGFLLAGAKAVVSSLWKVNSIATAFLFDEFYRQLNNTDNKAVALQNAQNWLRHCTANQLRERAKTWNLSTLEPKERFRLHRALERLKDIPFNNPYYWAAFILTGC